MWECRFIAYSKLMKCWLLVKGEYGRFLYEGTRFYMRFSEEVFLPCQLEFDRQWYVTIGDEGIRLNLRKNEEYQIYM